MSRITTIESNKPFSVMQLLTELWHYRGLIWAFSARDLKVKYFQTIFGPLWVVMTPLITVGVMTFVFGLMIKIPSDDLPYLMFYLVAIVPWYAFIAVLNQTVSSLEAHSGLISKIYFPRLVIGASYVLNGTVDFLVGYCVAVGFAIYFSLLSFEFILIMPLLLFIQMAWALGLGLMLAPYNARYRDVKHIVPLVIQLYYFASPIMYPVSVAPVWAQWIYMVNPFAVVINTYRTALNGHPTDWLSVMFALVFASGVLAFGAFVFLRKEQSMVDVL
jgi:lipopolysaccharide transport system permease protein